jgi:hypothetical protein
MANEDKRITDLPPRSSFDETCVLPIDDFTQTFRVNGNQIKKFIQKNKISAENIIENGNFEFWQRADYRTGGTEVTVSNSSLYYLSADRFFVRNVWTGSNSSTIDRSTDVPTFSQSGFHSTYSMKIANTSAFAAQDSNDIAGFGQFIEPKVWQQLCKKEVTLSFWVKSSKTGTYCVNFKTFEEDSPNTCDVLVKTYTINAANTWEKKTITLTLEPPNISQKTALKLGWALACGSDFHLTADEWQEGESFSEQFSSSSQVNLFSDASQSFLISQVCLREGSEDQQSYFSYAGGSVLADFERCLRYFEGSGGLGTSKDVVGVATPSGGGTSYMHIPFTVKKVDSDLITFTGNTYSSITNTINKVYNITDGVDVDAICTVRTGFARASSSSFTSGEEYTFNWSVDAGY